MLQKNFHRIHTNILTMMQLSFLMLQLKSINSVIIDDPFNIFTSVSIDRGIYSIICKSIFLKATNFASFTVFQDTNTKFLVLCLFKISKLFNRILSVSILIFFFLHPRNDFFFNTYFIFVTLYFLKNFYMIHIWQAQFKFWYDIDSILLLNQMNHYVFQLLFVTNHK